jgi:hypothetical protein
MIELKVQYIWLFLILTLEEIQTVILIRIPANILVINSLTTVQSKPSNPQPIFGIHNSVKFNTFIFSNRDLRATDNDYIVGFPPLHFFVTK